MVATAWILGSDVAVIVRPDGWSSAAVLSISKGLLFVAVTAALLQVFVERSIRRAVRLTEHLSAARARFQAVLEQSVAGMYVLEEGRFTYANGRLARMLGHEHASDLIGREFASFVAPEHRAHVDTHVAALRVGEPAPPLQLRVVRRDGSPATILAEGQLVPTGDTLAFVGLAGDVTERAEQERQIQAYIAKVERAARGTLGVVSKMVELRDPYTGGHERRVGEIAAMLGAELGLDRDRVEGLRIMGWVHDVGKIAVPAEILTKPGKLTPAEMEVVREHARHGYEILKDVEFPWPVALGALQHHERMDGTGYPQGLRGSQIPLDSRILAVADTLEAISSHRPYRPALGIERALGEIARLRGSALDPDVVAACLRLYGERKLPLPV
ncbi:MAG: HD-GYP domain-containing protein [Myxococcota bacterium]